MPKCIYSLSPVDRLKGHNTRSEKIFKENQHWITIATVKLYKHDNILKDLSSFIFKSLLILWFIIKQHIIAICPSALSLVWNFPSIFKCYVTMNLQLKHLTKYLPYDICWSRKYFIFCNENGTLKCLPVFPGRVQCAFQYLKCLAPCKG